MQVVWYLIFESVAQKIQFDHMLLHYVERLIELLPWLLILRVV